MKNMIYGFLILLTIWVILLGNLSLVTFLSGAAVSMICMWFVKKFFPLEKIRDVRFFRLVLFFPYLIKEIYVQGFLVIRKIFSAAEPEIIIAKTELKSDFLKAVLVNSLTLTPGSIALDIQDDKVKILSLTYKNDTHVYDPDNPPEEPIEQRLRKVEK